MFLKAHDITQANFGLNSFASATVLTHLIDLFSGASNCCGSESSSGSLCVVRAPATATCYLGRVKLGGI